MKYLFLVLITFFLFVHIDAQNITVTGNTNTTPNLATSYTTLAGAITALNSITAISGSVSFSLASGYKEIAPAGGYAISFSATTTASNTIIIDGGPTYDTIVANSGLTAGSLTDAVIKIIGCDYITITRFTMIENSSNTTTTSGTNNMTEWGVALLRSSNTNGAQHNSIIDNNISLDRTYANTFGIYSNCSHPATNVNPSPASDIINGTTAPNHGNIIYSNHISNVNMGIAIIGSATDSRMDDSNDVGGYSSSTGNTITNWGGTSLPAATFYGNLSSEYYGILMRYQKNDNTSRNTLISSTSLSGSTAANIRGIHRATTNGTVTGSFSVTIDHNTVTITDNLPTGTSSVSRLEGILCSDKLADGILSISDNTITGLAITGSASGRFMRAISNTSSASEAHINRNIIKANSTTASALGGWFIGIDQTGTIANTIEINYNLIGDNATSTPAVTYSATAHGATIVRGINNEPLSNPTGTAAISITGNTLYGFVQANSSGNSHTYINCNHTTTFNSDIHIDGNFFANIDAHITGDVSFITSSGTMAASAGAQLSVSNNQIYGSFTKSLAGGEVYLYKANGSSGTGNTMTESGNKFSNITLSGSAIMHGWYNNEGATAAGPEKHITDNIFGTWTCSTSGSTTSNGIYCNWAGGSSEISGNVIYNISAYGNLNGILSESKTATELNLNGNQIAGLSSSTAALVAMNLTDLSTAVNVTNNNIDIGSTTGTSVGGMQFNSTSAAANPLIIYYNTSYVHATSLQTNFATFNVNVIGNTTSNINESFNRNNIFVNTSTPGIGTNLSLNYTTCIKNTGVSTLNNYNVACDNNVYWVGTMTTPMYISTATADSKHMIYYDNGTANQPQWSDFIHYIQLQKGTTTTCESHSLHMIPDLTQITFVDNTTVPPTTIIYNILNYTTINCPIFDHGNSQGITPVANWQYDQAFYGHDIRLFAAPYITDIGADQVIKTNTWVGGSSGNNWSADANWSLGISPDNNTGDHKAESVYIPSSTPQPVISSAPTQVRNIFFQSGTPILKNNDWLAIAGQIYGAAGSITNYVNTSDAAPTGSIELNAICANQTLTGGVFVNNAINNFKISNNSFLDVTPPAVTPSISDAKLDVYRELSISTSSTTLHTLGNLTLKSLASATANVAQLSSTQIIDGDVTVERYIHTGSDPASPPIPAQHRKSWQLLSTPTSGQTVRQSWMENMATGNDNLYPGYGTNIPGGNSSGPVVGNYDQDYDPTSGPGIKYWDFAATPPAYTFLSNTTVSLNSPRGYFLFVRGDRSVINFSGPFSAPVKTTLRQKGSLFQPSNAPASITFPANTTAFISVGNPYASAIDLNAMFTTGGFNNISRNIYVYDPLLGTHGGWQLLDGTNGFASFNATNTTYYTQGNHYPYIQSGSAFFVSPASPATGTITFTEAVKSTNQYLVTRSSSDDSVKLNATLYLPGNWVADGNVVFFGSSYSNLVDSNDLVKLENFGENFFITQDSGKYIVARRNLIGSTDSIFYSFSNLAPDTYTLKFGPSNLAETGLTAILIDNYRDTTFDISLDDTTDISFVVDSNATSMAGRFTLVFSRTSFSKMAIAPEKPSQKIFPNPVTNGEFYVELKNEISGNYNIQVVNSTGQVILKQMVNQAENKKTIKVNLGNTTPPGIYHVILSDEKGKKTIYHIIVR